MIDRLRDLHRGLGYGYPPCCVLSYALDPYPLRAARRGIVERGYRANGQTYRWVPCMYHKHRADGWRAIK